MNVAKAHAKVERFVGKVKLLTFSTHILAMGEYILKYERPSQPDKVLEKAQFFQFMVSGEYAK